MCRNLELGPERGNTVKGIQMQVRVRFFPKCINNLFWQPSLMAMPRQYMKLENSESRWKHYLKVSSKLEALCFGLLSLTKHALYLACAGGGGWAGQAAGGEATGGGRGAGLSHA